MLPVVHPGSAGDVGYNWIWITIGVGMIYGAILAWLRKRDKRVIKEAEREKDIDRLLPLSSKSDEILALLQPNGGTSGNIGDTLTRTEALAHDTNSHLASLADSVLAHHNDSAKTRREVNDRFVAIESVIRSQDRFCRTVHPERKD